MEMDFSWKIEAVCFLASFLIYSNTLDAGFVYDDHRAILKNDDVTSTSSSLPRIFADDFWGTPIGDSGSHGSYRPLTILTFRLNYLLSGDWPSPYHVTNVILHCVATVLFCLMLRIFRFNDDKRIISGLLFSLHPIHTEAVSGLVGRADVIAAIFLLANFLVYDRACGVPKDTFPTVSKVDNQCEETKKIQSLSHKKDHKKAKKSRKIRRKKPQKEKVKMNFDLNENLNIPSSDLASNKNGSISDDSTATNDTYDSISSSSSHSESVNNETEVKFPDQEFKEIFPKAEFESKIILNKNENLTRNKDDQDFGETSFGLLSLSFVLALCSLLSKEIGYCSLFLCVFHDVFIRHKLRLKSGIRAILMKGSNFKSLQLRCLLTTLVGLVFCISRLALPIILTSSGVIAPKFSPSDNPAAADDNLLTRVLTFNYLLAQNAELLVFPKILSFDWSMDSIPLVSTWSDVRNLETLGFYVVFLYGLIYLFKFLKNREYDVLRSSDNKIIKKFQHLGAVTEIPKVNIGEDSDSSESNHVIAFSFVFLVLSFLPSSNLFFYVGFVIAERVLYLPSIAACMLMTEVLWKFAQHLTDVFNRNETECYRKNKQRFLFFSILFVVLLCCASKTWNRNHDWKNEFNLYKSGVNVNPAKSLGNLGNVLRQKGDLRAAEEAYVGALKHRSNMADVHYNLGLLYQETDRLPEALLSYKHAIHYRETLAIAYLNSGVVLKRMGRMDEAIEIYERAAELNEHGLKDPVTHRHSQISALYNLGCLFAEQGKHRDAVVRYLAAVERLRYGYQAHRIYNMLGQSYVQLNLYENAEHAFKTSLKHKPDHVPTYLTYASLFVKTKHVSEAIQLYEAALAIDESNDLIFQHYSDFLLSLKNHEKAAKLLSVYIATKPNQLSYESVFNAANAHRYLNLNDKAEKYYRICTQMKPNFASAHMNLGAILHLIGHYNEAKISYERALKLKPGDFLIIDNLDKLDKLIKNRI